MPCPLFKMPHLTLQMLHSMLQARRLTLQTLHSTLQTFHSTLQARRLTLQLLHSMLQMLRSKFRVRHSMRQALCLTLQTLHSMRRARRSKLKMLHSMLQAKRSMPRLRRFSAEKPLACFAGARIETDEGSSCVCVAHVIPYLKMLRSRLPTRGRRLNQPALRLTRPGNMSRPSRARGLNTL